ncbi:MAG: hypothetical protein ACXVYV_04595 [Gaiellales bacterium]
MHRISRRMVAVVVLIGAIAAGGAAFTASSTVPATVAGYGTGVVSNGADVSSVNYTYSADGTTITNADLVFTSDVTADVVKAGFNSGTALTACTVSSGTGASAVWSCPFSQTTSAATSFNVLVSSN